MHTGPSVAIKYSLDSVQGLRVNFFASDDNVLAAESGASTVPYFPMRYHNVLVSSCTIYGVSCPVVGVFHDKSRKGRTLGCLKSGA